MHENADSQTEKIVQDPTFISQLQIVLTFMHAIELSTIEH